MRKSLKRNYILNVIYQILTIVIPIVTIPYLSRVLQPEAVGFLSYSESIVAYFSLFAVLGTAIYAQREIGKVQDDKQERSRVFFEIQIIRLITSTVSILLYIMYVLIIGKNLEVCLILTIEIAYVIFDISWFFQGIEEFGKTVTCSMVARVLNLIIIYVFVKSPSDLWVYALSRCGFSALGSMVLWLFLPKFICKVKGIKPFQHLKTIFSFFIPSIAIQVYTILDKSMIGWFTSSREENGYYEYAEKIVKMSITLISALASVLIPRVSKAYAENNMETVNVLVNKSIRFVWLLSIPLMFGFICLADVLIPVYLGDEYAKSILLMRIFSPLTLFVGMANIVGLSFLIPINKQKVYLCSVVIAAAVNLVLNLILIPKLFSVGAAIATVVAELVGITIQVCYVVKKKLLDFKKFLFCSWKYWIAGVIMGAVIYVVKLYLSVEVWSLIALILLGIVAYFLVLLIFRDSQVLLFLRNGLAIIKRMFCRKEKNSGLPRNDSDSELKQDVLNTPESDDASEYTDGMNNDDDEDLSNKTIPE